HYQRHGHRSGRRPDRDAGRSERPWRGSIPNFSCRRGCAFGTPPLVVSGGGTPLSPRLQSGGAIFNAAGTLMIEESTISNSNAGNGGGLTTTGGVVQIHNSALTGTDSVEAIRIEGGSVKIADSIINENSGGAINNYGTLSIDRSRVANNQFVLV